MVASGSQEAVWRSQLTLALCGSRPEFLLEGHTLFTFEPVEAPGYAVSKPGKSQGVGECLKG